MVAKKLVKGDKIGVVAPSSPYKEKYRDNFNRATKLLESMGYELVFSKNLFETSEAIPVDAQKRADDINEMFENKEINAIICLQGGDNANSVLPLLDYELIRNNPKIFMGLSDITTILNAIYTKTGLITYHTNDYLFGFGGNFTEYDMKDFNNAFVLGNRTEIKPTTERKVIREGEAEGKLVGGNLRCLLKLAGTEYFPNFKDSILFVEARSGNIKQYEYMFEQLKQIGVFDLIKGAIVGYVKGLQEEVNVKIQMEDILLRVSKDYSFPILKCDDFGHKNSNAIMPIGVRVKLDADNCVIRILEPDIKR